MKTRGSAKSQRFRVRARPFKSPPILRTAFEEQDYIPISLSSGVVRRVGEGDGVCVDVCVDVGLARLGVFVDVGGTRVAVGSGAGGRNPSSMLRTVPKTMLSTISKAITANRVWPLDRLL